jgi:methionine-rich copper-binding protein CopC
VSCVPPEERQRGHGTPLRTTATHRNLRSRGTQLLQIEETAAGKLRKELKLSERQAEAILNMRLSKLTALESREIRERLEELKKSIAELEAILASPERQVAVVRRELQEMEERYGDDRRTEIVPDEKGLTLQDLVAEEEVVVIVSREGYVKQVPMGLFRRRTGRGKRLAGMERYENDYLEHVFVASTGDTLLFFTEDGKVHWLPVRDIPEAGRASRGKSVQQLAGVPKGARVVSMRAPTAPGTYNEFWQLRDAGNQPVRVGDTTGVVVQIVVPQAHYSVCAPGEGTATLLAKKYPDGVVKAAGEEFRYSWTIRNNGECARGDGTTLRYRAQTNGRLSRLEAVRATRSVEPRETYTFVVPMRSPERPGVYREEWEVSGGNGVLIPTDGVPAVHAQVRVPAPGVPITTAPICTPGAAQVRFVDENWPDYSRVAPGQLFTKRWTVVNMGNCAWAPGYRLRYTSNTDGPLALSQESKPLNETVPPEAAYTFEVPMRAPMKPGFHREDWRFTDEKGASS